MNIISRDLMMRPVLLASPGFEPVWREFIAEWQDDREGLPLYLALSDLARHIASLLLEGNVESELRQIFRIVEDWHIHGDDYVKEAATIGLLEGLQNTNVVGDLVPTLCLDYLGPESLRWWRKVEDFWTSGEMIRDD